MNRSANRRTIVGWLTKNKKSLMVFAIYLTISLVAVLFHEPWEDEAQAWLTARDCTPIELVGRMKIEGHFLPWYLILMPFAKLGLPLKTTDIISWIITGCAAWLMLKNLPCKFYKRVLFIFTLPMLFLFPAVSRCHCLIPLATILAIMFYKNRFKNPLPYLLSIVLMVNTHIFCLMFAFVMGLEYLLDWIKLRKGLKRQQNNKICICIVGVILLSVLSILPLIGSTSSVTAPSRSFSMLHFLNSTLFGFLKLSFWNIPEILVIVLSGIFLSSYLIEYTPAFLKVLFSVLWQLLITEFLFDILLPSRAAISIFIILFFTMCIRWRPKKEIVMGSKWFTKSVLIKLFALILSAYLVIRTGLVCYSILCFIFAGLLLLPPWLKWHGCKVKNIDINIIRFTALCLLLCSMASSFITIKKEINGPFSDGLKTAMFISENLEDNSVFLTLKESDAFVTTPVIASLADLSKNNMKFYNIVAGRYYTYSEPGVVNKETVDLVSLLSDFKNTHNIDTPLYYIEPYPAKLEEFIQSIEESGEENTDKSKVIKKNGVLTKIFSSKDENVDFDFHAGYEYYRIYKVDLAKL